MNNVIAKEILSLKNPGMHHSHICLEAVNDYYIVAS